MRPRSESQELGAPGLAAMMAALLDDRVRSVLVDRTLANYMSIVESESYSTHLAYFVPGILRSFDLPQIAAAMSPRSCWILNGVDANGQILSETSMRDQYTRQPMGEAMANTGVRILVKPEADPQESYLEWLKSDE